MSDREVLNDFLREMNAEFPNFRIIEKRHSPLSRAIDVFLKGITFGGQREFMTRYYTVIGDRLYIPASLDEIDPIDAVITLRHERVHLRQRRRYTMVGMTLLYLVFPFPLGLAYGRARIEWEAYTETLRAVFELRGERALRDPSLKHRIVTQFTSPAYGWMWPFKKTVERWYDDAVRSLLERNA
jgi:hypothetical protein